MKRFFLYAILSGSLLAYGEIPAGYYDLLSGKKGDDLKAAVKAVAHPSDYNRITYQDPTWEAFKTTDIRVVNGIEIWWDMYSNRLVTTDAHAGLNIEHSVANSWFGGKDAKDPYADLFHLNPSDQEANGQKSDNPLGEVETVAWQNGLVKTGTPKAGTAGNAKKVFEPADEYKGDFARAYFYIFTAYNQENWKTDQPMFSFSGEAELEEWAIDLLLRWAKADPVDSKEILRNEEIYKLQHNRNPFIDYPDLIDYVWGDRKDETFTPSQAAVAIDRPEPPVFSGRWMTGVNTYSDRWWKGETVAVTHGDEDLWIRIDNGDWQQYGPGVEIPQATAHGATMTLEAFTECETKGYTLRSSTARLTLTGKKPDAADYTDAVWWPVKNNSDFIDAIDGFYIIWAAANGHIMGHQGGTSSKSYQPDAGFGIRQEQNICRLPVDAAIVRFRKNDTGKYLLEVLDALTNKSKGYWNVGGSGNKHTLKANTGTVATVAFNDEGNAIISFDGGKSLQYNASTPRFTNYSSNQGKINLSRFHDFLDIPAAIIETDYDDEGCVAIDGREITLPQGWMLFELNGRRSTGRHLEPGIYIARSPKGKTAKILIK